jgi:hypothetical protein
MQFANSQVWGRASKICLKQVTTHAYSSESHNISDTLAAALTTFKKVLNSGKSREIISGTRKPRFIFTDASFEPADVDWPAGVGGVLYDEYGRAMRYFSDCLEASDLAVSGFPEHKQTFIFETEILAVIVALQIWKEEIADRPIVIFVDNNSAKDVAISGSARTKTPLMLVSLLLTLEDEISIVPWYARVPSNSNPADEPPRSDKELESLGQRAPRNKLEVAVQAILARVS